MKCIQPLNRSEINISSSVSPTDNFVAIAHTTNIPVSIRQPQSHVTSIVTAGLPNEQGMHIKCIS